MPIVTMPDGALVDLPDNPTPQQLESLRKLSAGPESPEPVRGRTITEELGRQLGLTARAGIQGVTGTAGALGDAANTLINMALPKGTAPLQKPSDMLQRFMDQIGLPKPETTMEKASGFGASALAGAGDPILRAAQLATSKAFPAPQQAADTAVIRELHDAGIKLPPSQAGGGAVSRTLEGFGGKARTAEMLTEKNQEPLKRLAEKALNLPKNTPLTHETLDQTIKSSVAHGYDPIKSVPYIGIGSKYRNDMAKIVQEYGGSRSFPQATRDQIRTEVNKYLFDSNGRYIKSYTGEDAIQSIKLLREEATANITRGGAEAKLLGLTQNKIAKALEENVELNLSRMPKLAAKDLVGRFRDARTQIAKANAVKEMLVDPSTGIIDATKAASMLQRGKPLTGELRTIAKAGSPLYSKATKPPTQGAPVPWNMGDSFLGGGGVVGLATGNPLVGGLMAGLPPARAGARNFIGSDMMQNALVRGLDNQGGFFASPAGQRALVASPFALFSQGEQ